MFVFVFVLLRGFHADTTRAKNASVSEYNWFTPALFSTRADTYTAELESYTNGAFHTEIKVGDNFGNNHIYIKMVVVAADTCGIGGAGAVV